MRCCINPNIVKFNGKCGDLFTIEVDKGKFDTRYGVPSNIGDSHGDYIRFSFCANCGQMVGNFPIELDEDIEENDGDFEDD